MSLPDGVIADFPLARLTTVRTGGSAQYFARPEDEETLIELLSWAGDLEIEVGVVGSGSNLLVSDAGVRGLVVKLSGKGQLTRIERESDRVLCGGGARLPKVAAKAARWGLAGIEFGVNIPGSVGGAVRMNANAYGGALAETLDAVRVCNCDGVAERGPEQLGFSYRHSNLKPGEVVSGAAFSLRAEQVGAVKERMDSMRARRHAAQPSGIKTFGSTFKNPDPKAAGVGGRTAGQLLEAAQCRGLGVGAARFSPEHANFVENRGAATTAEVLELIDLGRRRVRERFGVELETEVQLLGRVDRPDRSPGSPRGAS